MKIGVWGDSITYGAGDREALGWVGRLRKSAVSKDIEIYNLGVCGDTTEDLLERFSIEADSIQPKIVIFAIGINDSKYLSDSDDNKVSPEAFRRNMRRLFEQARKYTQKIYIVGPISVNEKWRSVRGSRFLNETIEIYNNCLKEISESEHLAFINTLDLLNQTTDLADGLHPNARGYQKLAHVIGEIIKS